MCSFSASATPRFSVVVVFATPPFWFAKAMTLAIVGPLPLCRPTCSDAEVGAQAPWLRSFRVTLAESFAIPGMRYERGRTERRIECRRVHRRRGRVRPLHGAVLRRRCAVDGRPRGSRRGTTRRRRRVRTGCADGASSCGESGPTACRPSIRRSRSSRRRRSAIPGVDVRLATAEQLPFGDDEFDRALAQLVVHFMADPVEGLEEMRRVTRRRRHRRRVRVGSRGRHRAGEPVLGGRARARRGRPGRVARWPARAKAISRSCSSRRGFATSTRRRSRSPSSRRASTRGGSRSHGRRRRRAGAYLVSLDPREQQARAARAQSSPLDGESS